MTTSQSVNESCNNVHQKWSIYQEFLTHLADFFLYVYVYKYSVQGQMAQLIGMFIYPVVVWSALYIVIGLS